MSREKSETRAGDIDELLSIMARLRDPHGGCPWDQEQSFATIAPYTLEEAYEVVDAIQRNDADELCDELGDLLFQVVFHAQMAEELGWFRFSDVVTAINDKLIRRHPHVFGDQEIGDARAQSEAWERHKAQERAARGAGKGGALQQIPVALPALVRAQKIQRHAARVGFDWEDISEVVDKLEEELVEFKDAMRARESRERLHEELGDLLFSCVNLSRFLEADAETLLRDANQKFEKRFHIVEKLAEDRQRDLHTCSLQELEALWQEAKQQIR